MKNEKDALKLAIIALEEKRNLQLEILKDQFLDTTESLKLINIIKSTFNEVAESAEIKLTIFENLVGVGTGLLAKKILHNDGTSTTKNIFAAIIQFVISDVISNRTESTKYKVEKLIYTYLKHRRNLKR